MSFIGSISPDNWASDANAYFDYLSARPEVSGTTFGITGYCMGGRAALTVAGLVPDRVAAAASFHGGGLVTDGSDSPHLRADQIQAVVYVGGAQNDASFTDDHAEQLEKALTAAGVEHKIETYAAAHGYAVPDNRPMTPMPPSGTGRDAGDFRSEPRLATPRDAARRAMRWFPPAAQAARGQVGPTWPTATM